jgi:hypothetical protein
MKLNRNRFSLLTLGLGLGVALASTIALSGCSKEKTSAVGGSTSESVAETAEETVAIDTVVESAAVASDAETEAVETTAGDSLAAADTTPSPDAGEAVAVLPADSPTCEAFATVKRLNDETGELTNDLQSKMLAVISAVGSNEGSDAVSGSETIKKEFGLFIDKFNVSAKKSVPQLQAAYKTLAKEQPQFKAELAAVEDVTVKAIAFFGSVEAKKLDTFQEDLIGALGMETVTAAGTGSLKIDAFSRKACNLTFANS